VSILRILVDVIFRSGRFSEVQIAKEAIESAAEIVKTWPTDQQSVVVVIKDREEEMAGHQFSWTLMVLITDKPESVPANIICANPSNIGRVIKRHLSVQGGKEATKAS